MIDGRGFNEIDRPGAPRVAVVNATMARRYWPNESAVGHTFTVPTSGRSYQVVGVVADHKNHRVLEAPAPLVHFASAQEPTLYNTMLVRTAGDAGPVLASIRRELLALEPGLVFLNNGTMADNLAASLMPARVGALLATGFGALGTLLAAIGLYGVIAFSVARRTREIGVRMALGARPQGVLAMVLRQGFALVAAGMAVGGLLAAAVSRAVSGMLFGVSPLDPAAWGLALGTLLVAAAAANLVPARRAMRVDPVTALRTE